MFAEESPHLRPLPLEGFRYFREEVRTVDDARLVQVRGGYYAALPATPHTEVATVHRRRAREQSGNLPVKPGGARRDWMLTLGGRKGTDDAQSRAYRQVAFGAPSPDIADFCARLGRVAAASTRGRRCGYPLT
jgi:hypothetical protein